MRLLKYSFVILVLILKPMLMWAINPLSDPKGFKKDILIGFYGGLNFSLPHIKSGFDILSQAGTALPGGKDYGNFLRNRGFQLGVLGYMKVLDHIAFSVWPGFSHYNFNYSVFNNWADGSSIQNSTFRFTDRYNTIKLPMEASYIFLPDKKLNLFVSGGLRYEFIFGSSKKLDYYEEMISGNQVTGTYSESISSGKSRMLVRNNFQLSGGAGLMYNFRNFTLIAEATYMKGMVNITRTNSRFDDPKNLYTFPDIQDNLIMNNIVINIALLYKIYKAPKKLKCVTP